MNKPADIKAPPKRARGLRRVINAVRYSMEGIGSTIKHEEAFRQELLLTALLAPVALLMPVALVYKLLLIGSLFLILIVELLNSAIEVTVDFISEYNEHFLAKRAKDMASGAVFLSLLNFAVIWVLVIAVHWSALTDWMSRLVLSFL